MENLVRSVESSLRGSKKRSEDGTPTPAPLRPKLLDTSRPIKEPSSDADAKLKAKFSYTPPADNKVDGNFKTPKPVSELKKSEQISEEKMKEEGFLTAKQGLRGLKTLTLDEFDDIMYVKRTGIEDIVTWEHAMEGLTYPLSREDKKFMYNFFEKLEKNPICK